MAKTNPLSLAAQVAESMKAPEKLKAAPSVATAVLEPAPVKTTREGKRFLGYYVEPQRHEEIKQAALDEGIQIQEVLRQAVDAWMEANGTEAIATVERRRARRAGRQ